jgi:hypothetical protein
MVNQEGYERSDSAENNTRTKEQNSRFSGEGAVFRR